MGRPDCDSVAIKSGRIAALGRSAELRKLTSPETRLVDLNGATVAPGFIDCHLHFLEAASVAAGLDLSGETSLARMLDLLRDYASGAPPGEWVKAFGCDEAQTVEGRGPSRDELDRAVPRNPLRLRHQTLHASWLNSRGIEALGLATGAAALPAGARALRDLNGNLSGLVVGMEEWLSRRIPRVSLDDLEARARTFSSALARAGVTSFTDAGAGNGMEELRLFAGLARVGAIRQRIGMMIGAEHLEEAIRAGLSTREEMVALRGVKFMPAPIVRARSGKQADEPTRELWISWAERAQRMGLPCAFHATEVEELETALGVIEGVQSRVGATTLSGPDKAATLRFRIEHASLIPPNYLERLLACGAWVVSNPGFLYFRGRKYAAEPGLLPYLFPLRSLVDAGVPVAAGTDAPVTPTPPLAAICAAATRRDIRGEELCTRQALSVEEALSLFTTRAAQLSGSGGGELAQGKAADLVVLDANPLDVQPEKLRHLRVRMTIVGGEVIYEQPR